MTNLNILSNEELNIVRVHLEKIKINVVEQLNEMPMARNHLTILLERTAFGMALKMTTYIAGMERERFRLDEKWPEDWKQAVKERFAPKWWTRRHPVVYTKIHINEQRFSAVCPHLNIQDEKPHLDFLMVDHPPLTRLSGSPPG